MNDFCPWASTHYESLWLVLAPVPTGCLWSPQILSIFRRHFVGAREKKVCWDKKVQKPNAFCKKSWLACVRGVLFLCLFFFSFFPLCRINLSGFKIRAVESSGILGAKHKHPSFVLSSVCWISVNTEHIRRVIPSLPLSFPSLLSDIWAGLSEQTFNELRVREKSLWCWVFGRQGS